MDISTPYREQSAITAASQFHCCRGRLPWITLILSGMAAILQICTHLNDRMSFDRTAIASGEYWRMVTGHLTHWNADHMAWDVAMFVVLGAMIERRRRAALCWLVIGSAAAISLAVWIGDSRVDQYRGLSGIDSALFTFAALILFDDARQAEQTVAVGALAALAAAFVGKLLWELVSGSTLFVDSSAACFRPLPLVHAVGGCVGVFAWWRSRATLDHEF
jgi:rhomboid family GlyGly-CTERM serine protease